MEPLNSGYRWALHFHGVAWYGSIWNSYSVPNWSAFELGLNWNRIQGNRWNSCKAVWIESEKSSKRNDWHAYSALVLFSCIPTRKKSPAQFRISVPNETSLVEIQGLSVPICYGSK